MSASSISGRFFLVVAVFTILTGCLGESGGFVAQPAGTSANSERASSHGYKLLYSFKGAGDGLLPESSLTPLNGKLYGTTSAGGNGCPVGCGTIYAVTTAGKKSVLYSFRAGGTDGAFPHAGLIDVKGTLYGTTVKGGTNPTRQYGTVYKVTTTGIERVVYSFNGSDGAYPYGNLILVNGTFYGTTSDGGTNTCYSGGCGTLFSLSATGKEHVLYSFKGLSENDGSGPYGALALLGGSIYGATRYGGTGVGTVFKSSLSGKESVLYRFERHDGWYPSGSLTLVNGKLYGSAGAGGAYGYGAVYAITPGGKEQVLYAFKGRPDGSGPNGPLVAINGFLYGTTASGGTHSCFAQGYGCGTIFKLSLNGEESVLYNFSGGDDGSLPGAGLAEVNGLLYGTTTAGGTGKCSPSGSGPAGCGTIFAVAP